ncbi:hypothetical protein BF95_19740 [Sphingobium sp. Ant17]|nr:hypothetical protein BF95_06680 [Sphingobium sp. Ant17]EXS67989.1 hypothetical protein BF95_19740 [Sphingobium sp. Ant17]
MRYTGIVFAMTVFSIISLLGVRMVIDGLWLKQWKFAFGSLALAVFFAAAAYERFECAKTDCPPSQEDPSVPRIR